MADLGGHGTWPWGPVVFAPDWVELARRLQPAVVNIAREDGTESLGSGFVISPDGRVVTNDHVIDRASGVQVTFADARRPAERPPGFADSGGPQPRVSIAT